MGLASILDQEPFRAYNFQVVLMPDFGYGKTGIASVAAGLAGAAAGAIASAVFGNVVSGFTSVTGMHWKTEVRTVREGGLNDREHKLPGRTTCKELVFSRGVCAIDPMWEWYRATMSGHVLRMNGLIFLTSGSPLSSPMSMLGSWHFSHAWPTELSGVQLDASQSLLAVQQMTLAVESIQRTI
jgi:phage tail-like protein